MKTKIKKAIDYVYERSEILAFPLFLWTILATAGGIHKLDWIDASFLILYVLFMRNKI
jgi:hypothetical protein